MERFNTIEFWISGVSWIAGWELGGWLAEWLMKLVT